MPDSAPAAASEAGGLVAAQVKQAAAPTPDPAPARTGGTAVATSATGGGVVAPDPSPVKHAAKSKANRKATGSRGSTPSRSPARPATPAAAPSPAKRADHKAKPHKPAAPTAPATVIRTFEHVVQVVPAAAKAAIAALAFLALAAAAAYLFRSRTARYLSRQRKALLGEIGVLQAALLPEVPDKIGGLRPSVAYRPADGPAAGGDFYDAFPLEGGLVGIVVGDISGHGREALMRTSLLRHTMRAYLDAGLEPRTALQVGGRVLDRGLEEIATVILATYDPATHILRYANAGHPPPVFLGAPDHPPVTQGSSPPIGAGVPTGLRQTTVTLPPKSAVCFFTDGLIEARRGGDLIGRLGLQRIIADLGPDVTAEALLDRLAAVADEVSDDMAACLFRVDGDLEAPAMRREELEVRRDDASATIVDRFLEACGVDASETARVGEAARHTVERYGSALVRVSIGTGSPVADVVPANVESLVSAESLAAAG